MSYNLVNPTTGDLTRVAGGNNINDETTSTSTTWSSEKINANLGEKADTDKVAKKIYIKDTSSQDARTLIQNHWSEFDRFEFYNLHIDTAKWTWDAEIYAHTQEYGTVLLRSYGSDVPNVFYGKLYNGVWTWTELATMDKLGGCSIIKGTTTSITNSSGAMNLAHGGNFDHCTVSIQPTTNKPYFFSYCPLSKNNTYIIVTDWKGEIVTNTEIEFDWVVIGW